MPKIKNVEKRICELEGFHVAFHQNGQDVHGAKAGIPQYDYSKAASKNMTVSEWKKTRFNQSYSGFEVVVYDADRNKVPGQTTLETVRNTYPKGQI